MRKFFIYAFSLIIALFACDMSLFAQRLTEAQKRTLERRVEDKVNEFQFYMAQLGDKESTSVTVKNNAYGLALKLFIGEGEDYSIVRQNSRGEEYEEFKPAVRMETSSKYRSTKSRTKIKTYLNNLRNNDTYTQIEITAADVWIIFTAKATITSAWLISAKNTLAIGTTGRFIPTSRRKR